MTEPEQRWRPIRLMPAFKFAISRAAETSCVQAENMRLALDRPELINHIELARLRLVYQDTARYAQMCREQLSRWRGECVSPEQHALLDQLEQLVEQWIADTRAILDAADALLANA